MFKQFAISLLVTAAFAGLVAPVAPATAAEAEAGQLEGKALLEALRAGGCVVYLRHAQTEKDYADQVTADPTHGATQRVLSEAGWHQAKGIGESVRSLGVPVGKVVSSEYFRAWQTADLAFGHYEKDARLNFLPVEAYTPEQSREMRDRVLPIVSQPPEEGTNTFVVGHDDPFEAVTGIYPEPQGVAYVLRPVGGDVEVLGRIPSDGWDALTGE